MRIDKFLKNSRIIKRRTVAKDACDQGKILVNGKEAKPGTEVKVGDQITLEFGQKKTVVVVEDLSEHVTKDLAKAMFREIE
jgi:ribosomal 50S subunit-recycling heat shock protein